MTKAERQQADDLVFAKILGVLMLLFLWAFIILVPLAIFLWAWRTVFA